MDLARLTPQPKRLAARERRERKDGTTFLCVPCSAIGESLAFSTRFFNSAVAVPLCREVFRWSACQNGGRVAEVRDRDPAWAGSQRVLRIRAPEEFEGGWLGVAAAARDVPRSVLVAALPRWVPCTAICPNPRAPRRFRTAAERARPGRSGSDESKRLTNSKMGRAGWPLRPGTCRGPFWLRLCSAKFIRGFLLHRYEIHRGVGFRVSAEDRPARQCC
jgi:hypothetical protein